jgi:hypothetical protein
MGKYLAIVIYRCLVKGEPTGSLDVQTRYYEAESEDAVRSVLANEESVSYTNSDGDQVAWELRETMNVGELSAEVVLNGVNSGDELIGFITDISNLLELA